MLILSPVEFLSKLFTLWVHSEDIGLLVLTESASSVLLELRFVNNWLESIPSSSCGSAHLNGERVISHGSQISLLLVLAEWAD